MIRLWIYAPERIQKYLFRTRNFFALLPERMKGISVLKKFFSSNTRG
jgi:hypothetical protein